MAPTTIGMIGLGLLGSALSQRLMAQGHKVLGFDIDPGRCDAHLQRGGQVAESSASLAKETTMLLLNLPNSTISETVIGEILPSLSAGTLVIDTTTGDPQDAVKAEAVIAERGGFYLDATVAGSSAQAQRGDILVLVGGDREAFQRCADLFGLLASRTFYCGPAGAGRKMKLVVNLVLGLHRAVLAEGLAFARGFGIDLQDALDVLRAGPTYSKVMDTKGEKMIREDFSLEARLAQHLKDVRLILANGEKTGASLPFSTLHAEILESLVQRGLGNVDNSAVIRAFDVT